MADRYCGNCGRELREDDRFCPNCGRPVHEVAQVPTPEADVPVPPPPGQQDAQPAEFAPQDSSEVPPRRSTANKLLVGCDKGRLQLYVARD